jgi:hypothetical protein
MQLSDFVKRADELIAMGNSVLATTQTSQWASQFVADEQFAEFRSAALSFLDNVFGASHPYTRDFHKRVDLATPDQTREGIGMLRGARSEVAGGWAVNAKTLVSAEIFSDFLEMAEYLLASKYKDASAVMIGSVLEEHLRQLCRKHGVTTTVTDAKGRTFAKKAEAMNSDLASANVYNKLDQKNVTAWLDLRNKAAHGQYADYTQAQVEGLLAAVTEFMARVAP